jgi:hypothetical protein
VTAIGTGSARGGDGGAARGAAEAPGVAGAGIETGLNITPQWTQNFAVA